MSYHFVKDESVAKGTCRLVKERVEHAMKCLDQPRDEMEAVHSARKDIKKLRAILRLVRLRLGTKLYRRETDLLRDAAEKLAPVRDARVKLATIDALAEHFQERLAPKPFPKVRAMLKKENDQARKIFARDDGTNDVKDLLTKMLGHADDWRFGSDSWGALGPGLRRAYKAGRDAYALVQEDDSAENFHEWRKRVKDLWYHLSLLRRVWSETIDSLRKQAEVLSEYLGDEHDLAVLSDALAAVRKKLPEDEVETLHGLIDLRRKELRAEALALGGKIYMEKPSVFSKRIGGYWKKWRNQKNGAAVSK